jgi:uncharacterized protein (DUF362 family)
VLSHCRFEDFTYSPPAAAYRAQRILVKPNLGYPYPPPVTVSMPVLARVLKELRRAAPAAEILIVEGVCHARPAAEIATVLGLTPLLDEQVRFLDADALPERRYGSLWAPALLSEVDCRISVAAYKRTVLNHRVLISASLKNLYGLFSRARYRARSPHSRGLLHRPDIHRRLVEVQREIGTLFDGAVVDLRLKFESADWRPDRGRAIEIGEVVSGGNLVATDILACARAGDPLPDYLTALGSATASESRPSRESVKAPSA